ncbi:MAG: ACP phosphodiesterase [Woeseiaceae bacterium]
MNWLAHIVLSRRDVAFQLGNVLADPLKGRAWPEASPALLDGMLMHKAIDRFTDAHPQIAVSKSRLDQRGRLRGVALDVIYDHFLAIRWDQYVDVTLADFLDNFHEQALRIAGGMPEKPRRFVERLAHSEMLLSYVGVDGVALAFERVDSRLSARLKAKETVSQYTPSFLAEYDSLLDDFDQFFPDLVAFFDWHPLGGLDTSVLRFRDR